MPHVAFHTFPVPEFSSPAFSTPCKMVPIIPVLHFPPLQFGADNSSPAFSTPAVWCRWFQSRIFQSRIFSAPSPSTPNYFQFSSSISPFSMYAGALLMSANQVLDSLRPSASEAEELFQASSSRLDIGVRANFFLGGWAIFAREIFWQRPKKNCYAKPALLDSPHPIITNIFIRQIRQQDKQRTDYIHKEKKYTQQ